MREQSSARAGIRKTFRLESMNSHAWNDFECVRSLNFYCLSIHVFWKPYHSYDTMTISVVRECSQVNENKLAARFSWNRWAERKNKHVASLTHRNRRRRQQQQQQRQHQTGSQCKCKYTSTLIKSESYVVFMCQAIYLFIVSTAWELCVVYHVVVLLPLQ